jgi:hypothetical protein
MTSFNQIGPWITAGVLFAIIVFFCIFYISRLLTIRKTYTLSSDDIHSETIGDVKITISKEQKNKLKDDIVHDIVADITPVLKKRLEKAF